MGIMDLLATAMGQQDPRARLAAQLGQGPGSPSNPGPTPAPAPPAGPQHGMPTSPGPPGPGGYDPTTGPPQQDQGQQTAPSTAPTIGGQPAPQAYSSPSDLGQAYLQLAQRQMASNNLDRHLGMIAASMYPGRHPEIITQGMQSQQQDPGAMFNNILQLQQYGQQQGRYQDMLQNPEKWAKGLNMDPETFKTLVQGAGPEGAAQAIAKIAETQAGVGGNSAWMAQQRAEKAYDARGEKLPWTRGDPSSYDAWTKSNTAGQVDQSKKEHDDLVADQHNFAPALQNYDKTIGLVNQFMQPDMQEAAKAFLGPGGQFKGENGLLTGKSKEAWALYKDIMAGQFSAGTQDFKGAGRITNQMLTQDAPSQSTMGTLNQDPDAFFKGVGKYQDQLTQHRASLFGPADHLDDPRLTDEDYAKYVRPNVDLYPNSKTARNIPDFSKMRTAEADKAYDDLPPGKVFIDTDGTPKKKPLK